MSREARQNNVSKEYLDILLQIQKKAGATTKTLAEAVVYALSNKQFARVEEKRSISSDTTPAYGLFKQPEKQAVKASVSSKKL